MSHRSLVPSVHIHSSESPPGYLPPALTQYAEKLKSRFFPNPPCSPLLSLSLSTTPPPYVPQAHNLGAIFNSSSLPTQILSIFFPLPFRNICFLSHLCYSYSIPAISWHWVYGILTLLLFPAPPLKLKLVCTCSNPLCPPPLETCVRSDGDGRKQNGEHTPFKILREEEKSPYCEKYNASY